NQDRILGWCTDVLKGDPTHTRSFKALGFIGGVITAHPANVEHILKTNFANYPDGEQWLWQRKAASYEFSKRSLRNFVVDAVRFEIVERLLPLLYRARQDGRTLDVNEVLERFAFDNICRVAFGEDAACLAEVAAPRSAEFMRAVNDAQNVNSLWRLKRILNTEPEKRMREALGTIHGYADRIVRQRRERGEAGLSIRDDHFLSRFAASDEHSDESLRDVVTNFILAGRDTTSSALTWFFWLVSTRPDVEGRIVREIRAVRALPSHGNMGASPTFSFDELRDMQYLHAAITESMRLYPPVAMDSHSCKEDDVLPDGTLVGKGWLATYSAYAMARMEDIWGKDCEEFRPERWLNERRVPAREHVKYPVFHAGPRMCLGKEMVYIQMKSIVACVLERFSFRFVAARSGRALCSRSRCG
ncbi:Cytochrome P450 94B1, partial [Dichanthelium oligosanthes]